MLLLYPRENLIQTCQWSSVLLLYQIVSVVQCVTVVLDSKRQSNSDMSVVLCVSTSNRSASLSPMVINESLLVI